MSYRCSLYICVLNVESMKPWGSILWTVCPFIKYNLNIDVKSLLTNEYVRKKQNNTAMQYFDPRDWSTYICPDNDRGLYVFTHSAVAQLYKKVYTYFFRVHRAGNVWARCWPTSRLQFLWECVWGPNTPLVSSAAFHHSECPPWTPHRTAHLQNKHTLTLNSNLSLQMVTEWRY